VSRAVANTLLPAARPASTIARPRPRELTVTNHTCAIHPPLSTHPPDVLEKLLKLRIGCAIGIRKGLQDSEADRLRSLSKDTAAEQGGKKVFHNLQRWIRLSANDRPKPARC